MPNFLRQRGAAINLARVQTATAEAVLGGTAFVLRDAKGQHVGSIRKPEVLEDAGFLRARDSHGGELWVNPAMLTHVIGSVAFTETGRLGDLVDPEQLFAAPAATQTQE